MEALSLLLLFGVGLWIAWPFVTDRLETRRDAGRLGEKIATRRALLARMPDSPAAHEALGDVLREAGRPDEAVACYQAALDLEARAGDAPLAMGRASGAGLENKLRLARQEADRGGAPVYGETLATRQQVCRRCGQLNWPQERACVNCGDLLPVDRLFDTVRRRDMRGDIGRETADFLAKITVVMVALYIASWMPLEVKGVLFISAAAVLSWRFLKSIGPG